MAKEDGIESAIGKFGRYQTFVLVLVLIGRLPTDFQLNNVVFIIPSVEYTCLDDGAPNTTNYCPCQNPQYDRTQIQSSVTSEWNLICDRKPLASIAQSMLQVGILMGSLIFGHISDRHGRKPAVLLALSLNVLFIVASALVPEFWMFMICRTLIGIAVGGTMLCCYVYIIELSGISFRSYLIGILETSFVIGYLILPGAAYFVRDWRYLQLVTSVPWVLVITYYWILVESPRWLITVGKKDEAIKTLKSIAAINKLPVENIGNHVNEIEEESIIDRSFKRGSYVDLFRTPKVRCYTIICALIWASCAHTFYGVNQYIGFLQGNIYLNVILSAAVVLPTPFILIIGALYVERRKCIITSFTLSGILLLLFIIVPSSMNITIIFAMIGQLCVFTAFSQIYFFTSELFPTVIRNSAMGFSSMFARIGGFLAPFVVNVGVEWISITVFSTLAFCAALLCYLLPETKDKLLLNSIQEAERSNDTTSPSTSQ